MADKFSTLFKSINDTMNNESISDKESVIITILQNQTLTSLKKLCGKKFLKVSGCSSQKVSGTTQQKKDQVLKLIISHLFGSKPIVHKSKVSSDEPIPLPKTKTQQVKELKQKLKEKGITKNLTRLTNNDPNKLKELLKQPRCEEDTDFSTCENEDSCFIKNKLCVDKDIKKIGSLERRPIIKDGQTYYVLSTKSEASELQQKIRDEEENEEESEEEIEDEDYIDDEVKQVSLQISEEMNRIIDSYEDDENFTARQLKTQISKIFPNIKLKYISYVITNNLIDQGYELKIRDFNFKESIFKSPSPSPVKSPGKSGRYKLFVQEGMSDVPGDGNCYFRCVSALLKFSYGVEVTHEVCRKDIARMIDVLYKTDSNFKSNFENIYGNITSYLEKMSKDGEWAGELEIIATSILYNVKISVITERLVGGTQIIPNIMYKPNNIRFRHLSESIIIDNQHFTDTLIWGLYHVGNEKKSGNHYTYNRNVLVDEVSFIDTFNPTRTQLNIFNNTKYYERWLNEYYTHLTYSKLQLSDFQSDLYDPFAQDKPEFSHSEIQKLRSILEQPTYRPPSPLAKAPKEPGEPQILPESSPEFYLQSPPESIRKQISQLTPSPSRFEESPIYSAQQTPPPYIQKQIEEAEREYKEKKEKKRGVMRHPGFRKPAQTQSSNKKLQEQIQKLLEIPDEGEIEESQPKQTKFKQTPKTQNIKDKVSNIMSKFRKGVV